MERDGAALVERGIYPFDVILSPSTALCIWPEERWASIFAQSTRQEEQNALLRVVCSLPCQRCSCARSWDLGVGSS